MGLEKDLGQTKSELLKTSEELVITKEQLETAVKNEEISRLQAEGAEDAMQNMKRDMQELVEVEIAEKEQQFEKIE